MYSIEQLKDFMWVISSEQAGVINGSGNEFVLFCNGTGAKDLDYMKFNLSMNSMSDGDRILFEQEYWSPSMKVAWRKSL